MDYETLYKVARNRRSIRRYTEAPVSRETILRILEVGRWAPSASNSQPWEWILVTDREKITKIGKILSDYITFVRQKNPKYPVHNVDYLQEVPLLIIVAADERVKNAWTPERANHFLQVSMGAAIQNVLLAATSLGLGSVWISGVSEPNTQKKIKEVLDIPNHVSLFACIPIGHSKNPPRRRYRRPLEETVHWNGFDRKKLRSDSGMEPSSLWKLMAKK